MKEIVIFGGSNVDYIAKSSKKFIPYDSNIGTLNISFGGVGRNIVENLARLGNKVVFFTALGEDAYGKQIKDELTKLGVDVISPKTSYPSSSYIAIHDENGEMVSAICDNRVIDDMSVEFLSKYNDLLSNQEYMFIDANSPQNVIDYLFDRYKNVKWWVEGVSLAKVNRFQDYLSKIFLFKANLIEAKALANSTSDDPIKVAKLLHKKGISNVIISNGLKPITVLQGDKLDLIEVSPINNVVNATGAGDALFSGIIDQFFFNHDLIKGVRFGQKLSLLTLEDEKAVTPKISLYNYDHD